MKISSDQAIQIGQQTVSRDPSQIFLFKKVKQTDHSYLVIFDNPALRPRIPFVRVDGETGQPKYDLLDVEPDY
jgi:hypothetical protein